MISLYPLVSKNPALCRLHHRAADNAQMHKMHASSPLFLFAITSLSILLGFCFGLKNSMILVPACSSSTLFSGERDNLFLRENVKNLSISSAQKASPVFNDCKEIFPDNALTVDLVLKSFSGHTLFLMPLLSSIRLLWPDYASLVVVVDTPNEAWLSALALPRMRWIVEPLGSSGSDYFGQMLSNLFLDNITTSPVVAILDSDSVLQLRVDRSTLTYDNKLIIRFLRCTNSIHESTPSPRPILNPSDEGWVAFESGVGCTYREGVEFVLGIRMVGNFMVQVPFVFPRLTLPFLRAYVERLHKKSFIEVLMAVKSNNMPFSQHSLIGNFLYFFGNNLTNDGVFLQMPDIQGIKFVVWGREDMFPHIGRHIGWEGKGKNDHEAYVPFAMDVVRKGLCRSYSNIDKQLCLDQFDSPSDLSLFQGQGFALNNSYNSAIRTSCLSF